MSGGENVRGGMCPGEMSYTRNGQTGTPPIGKWRSNIAEGD